MKSKDLIIEENRALIRMLRSRIVEQQKEIDMLKEKKTGEATNYANSIISMDIDDFNSMKSKMIDMEVKIGKLEAEKKELENRLEGTAVMNNSYVKALVSENDERVKYFENLLVDKDKKIKELESNLLQSEMTSSTLQKERMLLRPDSQRIDEIKRNVDSLSNRVTKIENVRVHELEKDVNSIRSHLNTCKKCNGTGRVRQLFFKVYCSHCDGRGRRIVV